VKAEWDLGVCEGQKRVVAVATVVLRSQEQQRNLFLLSLLLSALSAFAAVASSGTVASASSQPGLPSATAPSSSTAFGSLAPANNPSTTPFFSIKRGELSQGLTVQFWTLGGTTAAGSGSGGLFWLSENLKAETTRTGSVKFTTPHGSIETGTPGSQRMDMHMHNPIASISRLYWHLLFCHLGLYV
jgi:hypothetical protein